MNITQESMMGRGPKNKKQIGRIGKGDKIYIEDYAVTYLNQIARSPETQNGLAGLFGTCREVEGVKEYYIYSAIYQECERTPEGGLPREVVQKIIRMRGEIFSEYFFLGWALIYSESKGTMWESCYRSRLESLMGKPEVLMTLKCKSCEEHFYLYPTEMPKETEGYFIFYEQNDAMQNYLIGWHSDNNKDKCDEEGDNVAESCRNYYKEKKAKQFRARLAGMAVAATALLLLFVVGTTVQGLNEYEEIQEVGQAFGETEETDEETANELIPIQWEETSTESENNEVALKEEMTESAENEVQEESVLAESVAQEDAEPVESMAQKESVPAESIAQEENVSSESVVQEETDSMESVPAENVVQQEPVTFETVKEENEQIEEVVLIEEMQYVTYEVSKGDTLYGICVRFYGNLYRVQEICELNNIKDMNNILYGQKILLPK